jgi:catechol 2,3-dioxygenase-like lactoylglutathione lyase family enzyme
MKLFRIAIPAPHLQRSRLFYERILGIEADATVPSRLYFHCDGVILALIDWSGPRKRPFSPLPNNVYFATDELDAVHRRATDAGAGEMSPIETQPWGERSFYCFDPDGNPLCFVDAKTLFLGRGSTSTQKRPLPL